MFSTISFFVASLVCPDELVSKEKIYNIFNFFIAPTVLFFSIVTIPLALFFYIFTNILNDKKASHNFITVLFTENIISAYPYSSNEENLLPKDILFRSVDIITAPLRIYFSLVIITIELMMVIPIYLERDIDLPEEFLLAYVFKGDEFSKIKLQTLIKLFIGKANNDQ